MTRKHFETLALYIREQLFYISNDRGELHGDVLMLLVSVARACGQCNGNFDYSRFYKACGLDVDSMVYTPKLESLQVAGELENS